MSIGSSSVEVFIDKGRLGFSTISGAVLSAYVALGVPPQNLVTSSVMSIPASIAISKMRIPEVDEPVTRGRVVIDRGEQKPEDIPVNVLHAFSKGGLFGLNVAGQILWDFSFERPIYLLMGCYTGQMCLSFCLSSRLSMVY